MKRQFLFILITLGLSVPINAQVSPPCGLDYGTGADESNIIQQMRYGSISDAVNAINQAKNSRGTSLGCPQISYNYAIPTFTEPSLPEIIAVWNTAHAPNISAFNVTCPRIGRYENNAALGAYYAKLAGYFNDTIKLVEIANMMYDQQYTSWNFASPAPRNEGVFGYVHVPSNDPCYPGGVVGSSVNAVCSALPQYCENSNGGQFSGLNFLTSGQDDANSWHDGGLAYDHGWIGTQMIESAIQQNDPVLKEKYRNSITAAAQYCISEHSVKNHNYTAKLIWLLAQAYAWTGDTVYSNELNYKLNKNLIPGILWDGNSDGFVDGTSPLVPFSSLTSIAQEPGRMWDGHNSIPWYQAMNAWAMTEAYVAFRDQGDLVRAAELKPYVIAMVDNLSNEIINQGVVSPDQLGVRDITYALLTAIWKLSDFENEAHPNWESAAWAMWNSGYFDNYSTHSVCVGLYLLIQSNTPFIPLNLREGFVLSNEEIGAQQSIEIYPNPVQSTLVVDSPVTIQRISVLDLFGRLILTSNESTLDFSSLAQGVYNVQIETSLGLVTKKIIRN